MRSVRARSLLAPLLVLLSVVLLGFAVGAVVHHVAGGTDAPVASPVDEAERSAPAPGRSTRSTDPQGRPRVVANTDPGVFAMPNGNHVDAYWTPGARNVPWIVYIHGGFWEYGAAYTPAMRAWGQHERARGFAAFSIDYRLVPHVRWPTPETDVETAIAWIRARAHYFGLDLGRGFVVGHSAGGQLASIAALKTGDFMGVVDQAGATDPLAEYESAPDAHLRSAALALMGDHAPIDDPRLWASSRAATYVGRHRVAFLIVQSRGDRTVPFESSRALAAALREHGNPVTLTALPGSRHEMASAADIARVDAWVDAVLRSG